MTDDDTTDQTPVPEKPKSRWRDRVLGFRAVVAVALATLILGGLSGAAIGVLASGGDSHDQQRQGPGNSRMPQGGPGQMPGFGGNMPPGTPPQDDVEPDDSGDTSGDTGTNS